MNRAPLTMLNLSSDNILLPQTPTKANQVTTKLESYGGNIALVSRSCSQSYLNIGDHSNHSSFEEVMNDNAQEMSLTTELANSSDFEKTTLLKKTIQKTEHKDNHSATNSSGKLKNWQKLRLSASKPNSRKREELSEERKSCINMTFSTDPKKSLAGILTTVVLSERCTQGELSKTPMVPVALENSNSIYARENKFEIEERSPKKSTSTKSQKANIYCLNKVETTGSKNLKISGLNVALGSNIYPRTLLQNQRTIKFVV